MSSTRKDRVKLRWPERSTKPFSQVTESRRPRDPKPSPEALEALAVVEARFAPHADTPRKELASHAENAKLREARMRVKPRIGDPLGYVDAITTRTSAWDKDGGAGATKRPKPFDPQPLGYTARARSTTGGKSTARLPMQRIKARKGR